MPKNPFQAWSPNSSPESLFSPLFATREAPQSWRRIDYAPVVGSTEALIEAKFSNRHRYALKALSPSGPAMRRWQASDDPGHPIYWARESHFFRSDASRVETHAFRSVNCLDQIDVGERICMKLEWVRGTPGIKWQEHAYEQAAYALGTWQRIVRHLPDESWVCGDWLGGYLSLRADDLVELRLPEIWNNGSDFSYKEQILVTDILDMLEGFRERLLALPQLPAHNDFWPPNLFLSNRQIVAIDWAFVGTSPVGSDLCTLLFDSIYDGFFVPADPLALLSRLKSAYAEGAKLPNDRQLEFALLAGLVVKYLWFFTHVLSSMDALSDEQASPKLAALRLVMAAGEKLQRIDAF